MAMSNGNQPTGNTPPPKPWERAGTSTSGPTPFKPSSSSGGTSDVVEASGTSKPGEIFATADRNITTAVTRPPPRPWEQNGNRYGGYGSGTNYGTSYNSGYGSSLYGGSYGGLYGSSMYNRGSMYGGTGTYGGSMYGGTGAYGGSMYGGGMYNGGMYGSGYGGHVGGYNMGMGGPYGNQDPNNPPPTPPSFWMSLLQVLHGVVNFFGRVSMLIDQNTHALHMFMTAMLELFDRSGTLYGELARFILRFLGIKSKRKQRLPPGQSPGLVAQGQRYIEGPKEAAGSWDNVWGQ